MKRLPTIACAMLCLLLSACKPPAPACPPEIAYPQDLVSKPGSLSYTSKTETEPSTTMVKIGGKMTTVDKIIRGPLCDDTWKGTIYVACDVLVSEWEEEPIFLKDCNLDIAPGSVIYVAAHNDSAYFNGCSCHTSEEQNQ